MGVNLPATYTNTSPFAADFESINDGAWLKYVQNSSKAIMFHHPAWSSLLSEVYGYGPYVFVLRDTNGDIVGGLPIMKVDSWLTGKRWVSLPFTDYCGPLLDARYDLKMFCGKLIEKCDELKINRLEIRNPLPLLNTLDSQSYCVHTLALDKTPDELYKKFRKKGVQYSLKKAAKSGIVICQSHDLRDAMAFYYLHSMTRRKLGVPTQPKKYFMRLWEDIINRQMGFVVLANYNGKPIAGGIFLHFNKVLMYKYGATDPDYMHLCANHALLWEAIQWGIANGYQELDWGRTDKSNEGLRNFKLGWGTEEHDARYSYIGMRPKEYSQEWKQMLISNTIRRSPVWVGKLLGNLLYRHVG